MTSLSFIHSFVSLSRPSHFRRPPPWLGPTGQEKISNFGLLEWLKRLQIPKYFTLKFLELIEI